MQIINKSIGKKKKKLRYEIDKYQKTELTISRRCGMVICHPCRYKTLYQMQKILFSRILYIFLAYNVN